MKDFRRKIKRLALSVDRSIWKLAECLVEVYDEELYLVWGFKSWRDYSERELKFSVRKSQALVRTMKWLRELDNAEMVDWVKSFGWSKARYMAWVVTVEDFEKRRKIFEDSTLAGIQKMCMKKDGLLSVVDDAEDERFLRVDHDRDDDSGEIERFVRLRNAGVSVEKIVDEYGVDESDVKSTLRHVHFFIPVDVHEKMLTIGRARDMSEQEACRFLMELGVEMVHDRAGLLNENNSRRLQKGASGDRC